MLEGRLKVQMGGVGGWGRTDHYIYPWIRLHGCGRAADWDLHRPHVVLTVALAGRDSLRADMMRSRRMNGVDTNFDMFGRQRD